MTATAKLTLGEIWNLHAHMGRYAALRKAGYSPDQSFSWAYLEWDKLPEEVREILNSKVKEAPNGE